MPQGYIPYFPTRLTNEMAPFRAREAFVWEIIFHTGRPLAYPSIMRESVGREGIDAGGCGGWFERERRVVGWFVGPSGMGGLYG